MPIAHSDLR